MRVLGWYLLFVVSLLIICDYIEWRCGNPELRWLVHLFVRRT